MRHLPSSPPATIGGGRDRPARRSAPVAALALTLLCLGACTGAPATLAQPPGFALVAPDGPASVSLREALPGMTDSASERLIETAMRRALPPSVRLVAAQAPLPRRRIVWHVNAGPPGGTSTLVLNIFDGRTPVWYEQATIADAAPRMALAGTIARMTLRLDARAMASGGLG